MATQVKKETTAKQAPVKKESKIKDFEIKDRVYKLRSGNMPLTSTIRSRGIFWYDEDLGYERELKYTVNQKTPFVDEFLGDRAKLAHIIFKDGFLNVTKEKRVLQELLSLYHPDLGKIYVEVDNEKAAEDELDNIKLEFEAMNLAMNMDIDLAEAILRVQVGNSVSKMSSKEIKRDAARMAKSDPKLFLELANDENVLLRNVGITATEKGIIKLSEDNRHFMWGSNGRKLMTVPFDENPYSALASWFKTDEGVEVYNTIEKKLK